MKIKDMMSTDLVLLKKNNTLKQAVELFQSNEIDGAPVVDEDGKLCGLITKSHVYRAILDNVDFEMPVYAFMKTELLTAHPEDEAEEVLFPELPRVPVTEDTKVVGIVTRTDLAKAFFYSYQILSRQLDTIIDSTHNMIIAVDVEGKITVLNRSAGKLIEDGNSDVMGKYIWDVFPNSGLPDIIRSGKEQPLQKITINGVNYVSNRTPIKKDGAIIGAVAVLQDISEIEQISQELKYVKELNEELDAIIESSFDGLYITDGEGKTLRLNKAFEMITGINEDEFMGRNVEDIKREGIVSESVSHLTLKRREPVTIIQETRVGKTTLATGSPVFDKNGKLVRVVCNVRDITELNMLKQKLEQAENLSQHYESQLRNLRMQYRGSDKMVINSAVMRDVLDVATRVAQVDSTVLITGESGTGKELIAETIHNTSARNAAPFIKVNCGAIPENLLESELFGYEYGAFSGARQGGKPGHFELANGGTLFLDEIGEMPFNLQVKLLRVLQSREFTRVGGESPKKVNVRILAASNRNLKEMVDKRQFREDLYYRLNVVPVYLPPLRERRDDIPSLVVHFMKVFNRKYSMNKRISPDVVNLFMDYDWPGNVRELENLIERLMVVTPRSIIGEEDLPSYLTDNNTDIESQVFVRGVIPLRDAVESTEKQLIQKAYCNYRTTRQMAVALRVNASTIVRKAAKYGINVKDKIY